MMRSAVITVAAGLLSGLAAIALAQTAHPPAGAGLKPAASFDSIADPRARSVALFEEAGKVLQHPRCLNCHPAGDTPSQTDHMRPHQPPVVRGDADIGAAVMMCPTCHHAANFDPARVPGHPAWRMAPIEMAWQGKSLGQICEQIKDRKRNGDRDLAALVDHMAHDSLVGWGWSPGAGRTPAPGTQAEFGALIKAWSDTGAVCPAG